MYQWGPAELVLPYDLTECVLFDIGSQSAKLKLTTQEENEGYHQKDSLALSLYVYFHCLILLC